MLLKEKLMCSTYLGPTCYYSELMEEENITIEVYENFSKQTYRSRCCILGPNGPQLLNIPIKKVSGKQLFKDTQISYAEDWQKNHWKSIQTAYGSSPFFEVLAPELAPFYQNKTTFLLDLNTALSELMFNWIQLDITLNKSQAFSPIEQSSIDLRFKFDSKNLSHFNAKQYNQINGDLTQFYANLSIIDLMFNQGPMAWEYLNLKTP